MKAFLKNVSGRLMIGSTYLAMALFMGGVFSGVGTGIGLGFSNMELEEYNRKEEVKVAVKDRLDDEREQLNEKLQKGEIDNSEYAQISEELESRSYKDDIRKQTINELYGDDEQYLKILKNNEMLTKAHITTAIIGTTTFLGFILGSSTHVFDKLAAKGNCLIDSAESLANKKKWENEIEKEKKQKQKQEKEFQKKIDVYSEEIDK